MPDTQRIGLPLKLVGGCLLAVLVGWIVLSASVWHLERPHPRIVAGGVAFEGNLQLPKETIDQKINAARDRMDLRYAWSERLRLGGEVVDWAGFLCTALITLIAGYFGIILLENRTRPSRPCPLRSRTYDVRSKS
jgi:hypothetical protein